MITKKAKVSLGDLVEEYKAKFKASLPRMSKRSADKFDIILDNVTITSRTSEFGGKSLLHEKLIKSLYSSDFIAGNTSNVNGSVSGADAHSRQK